ncbi:MAG: DUF6580 family putative transport protein [Flavisolibacter sp.]
MKQNKSVFIAFGLLIIIGSVFRAAGFAPQIAMAVFGAAVIRDKRLAFIVPLLSMLFSDVFIEVLYRNGLMNYGGFYSGVNFYDGQVLNYILLAGLTLVGFWARNLNWSRIAIATITAPVLYFLLSNLFVWIGGGGYSRPHTFGGLMLCYEDALPFLRTSIIYTALFSAILFGGYFLVQRFVVHRKQLA